MPLDPDRDRLAVLGGVKDRVVKALRTCAGNRETPPEPKL